MRNSFAVPGRKNPLTLIDAAAAEVNWDGLQKSTTAPELPQKQKRRMLHFGF